MGQMMPLAENKIAIIIMYSPFITIQETLFSCEFEINRKTETKDYVAIKYTAQISINSIDVGSYDFSSCLFLLLFLPWIQRFSLLFYVFF